MNKTFSINLSGNDWLFRGFYGQDWELRKAYHPEESDKRWWLKATVPGSVVNDLWAQNQVKDPYFERNTQDLEWVSQRSWVYKKKFFVPEELDGQRVQIRFEGVDYESKYYLNGEYLGEHRGMFTPIIFDVEDRLCFGRANLIAVVIKPAPQEQPQVGRTSRVRTHKSRMTYWWDFCPRLVHQGIWDDVKLEISGPVRVKDLFIQTTLESDKNAAINFDIVLDAAHSDDVGLELILYQGDQLINKKKKSVSVTLGKNRFEHSITIQDPELWQPNGCGDQPLYQAKVVVHHKNKLSHEKTVDFGIRHVQFVDNDNAEKGALPYTLIVNGRKVYIKGWNWVPMDVLYGVPRRKKLERLLQLAKEAHVNVLRVWGGGLIEREYFYELCNKYGIFVWQEFILSSSGIDNEPSGADDYVQMLVEEAEQIIPRKRNHPSLLLWCGGNELQDSHGHPLDDSHPVLSALKSVVSRMDPDRKWLPTSPSGRVFSNSPHEIKRDPSGMHDVHGPWEYQGVREQYTLYNQGVSLLHSEFGVEGVTNKRTLDRVIHPDHQWPISLEFNANWRHLGEWWVKRDVWDRAFGELPDVESYIRATQLLQFDGLRYALEADRRRKYHNSGTLPWQFNEPYPMAACTSAVDYYTRPKPAYYAVKKAYEKVHVSARHQGLCWKPGGSFEAEIWVNNSNDEGFTDTFISATLKTADGSEIALNELSSDIPPNNVQKVMMCKGKLPQKNTVIFLDIWVRGKNKKSLASNRYVFICDENLYSLLKQKSTTLKCQYQIVADRWNLDITNIGDHTAMFVWVDDGLPLKKEAYVYFSDNYFCLFPGETRSINARWEGSARSDRSLNIKGWNTNNILLENELDNNKL